MQETPKRAGGLHPIWEHHHDHSPIAPYHPKWREVRYKHQLLVVAMDALAERYATTLESSTYKELHDAVLNQIRSEVKVTWLPDDAIHRALELAGPLVADGNDAP